MIYQFKLVASLLGGINRALLGVQDAEFAEGRGCILAGWQRDMACALGSHSSVGSPSSILA